MHWRDLSQVAAENATDFFEMTPYTETIFTEGGGYMTVYPDLMILLNFLVDGLLFMGANRLTGHPLGWKRCSLAAALGGVYAGVCILPGTRFLGSFFWRTVSLVVMVGIAYGWTWGALRRGTVFVLLSMALGGMAMGVGNGDFSSLLLSAGGITLLCTLGIRSPVGMDKYQTVELTRQGKTIRLTALVDTGNTLTDPITGGSVLVVSKSAGGKLGIPMNAIRDPVTALGQNPIPGARLIPYRSVGKSGGMLLLLRFEKVLLGGKQISPLVAFAPEEIGDKEGYQALAGGI